MFASVLSELDAFEQPSSDNDNDNFICDFQLNLELPTYSRTSKQITFPPFIKLTEGPLCNLFKSENIITIRNDLLILWKYTTKDIHCAKRIQTIHFQKTKHRLYGMLILLCLCVLFAFVTIPLSQFHIISDLFILKIGVLSGVVFIILFLYTFWYCRFHQNKQLNKVKVMWRKRFIKLLMDYVDELQSHYNDVRFVILYPKTIQSGYWCYIRVTKGAIYHDPDTLFYSPPITKMKVPIEIIITYIGENYLMNVNHRKETPINISIRNDNTKRYADLEKPLLIQR